MEHARAVIFDLDGTLVDSLQDITNALNAALPELEFASVAPNSVRHWIGDGLTTLCRRAAGFVSPHTLDSLADLVRKHYLAHCVDFTRPYPNILKMLDLLNSRAVPMGILSNKPHALTIRVVQQLDLLPRFAEVRGATGESDRKPSPANAIAISRNIGVEPRNVFLIGDSTVDIHTARNAGMAAIAVSWGFQDVTQLAQAKPDAILDDPLQIPELLDGGA
jgi:phosphoglycolate phosphatase